MLYECVSYLCGEINDVIAHSLISDLIEHKKSGAKKVKLIIDSVGGSVTAGLRIRKVVAELGIPVEAEVLGQCSSIAFVILQACTTRKALPKAKFILHFIGYSTSTLLLYAEELEITETKCNSETRWKMLQEEVILYSCHRSDLSRKEILTVMLESKAFDPRWAFSVGLLDDIIVGRPVKIAA
jgi:ATP-dependent protease ClpP protease subunit